VAAGHGIRPPVRGACPVGKSRSTPLLAEGAPADASGGGHRLHPRAAGLRFARRAQRGRTRRRRPRLGEGAARRLTHGSLPADERSIRPATCCFTAFGPREPCPRVRRPRRPTKTRIHPAWDLKNDYRTRSMLSLGRFRRRGVRRRRVLAVDQTRAREGRARSAPFSAGARKRPVELPFVGWSAFPARRYGRLRRRAPPWPLQDGVGRFLTVQPTSPPGGKSMDFLTMLDVPRWKRAHALPPERMGQPRRRRRRVSAGSSL